MLCRLNHIHLKNAFAESAKFSPFQNCTRSSSAFTQTKQDRFVGPLFPKWVLIAQLNPARLLLNRINLWRYRRSYDSEFRPSEFMAFARQRFFDLSDAVADGNVKKMKSVMTLEAFNELHHVMVNNRNSEKAAWNLCLRLNPIEHELFDETVISTHFRQRLKPLRPADQAESSEKVSKAEKTRLFELYCHFAWYHDDLQRKDLIKMGYRGQIVERADVFRPRVVSNLAFAKDVLSSNTDWLITRAHFIVQFPPARHVGYMARVAKLRAKAKESKKEIGRPVDS